KLQSRQAMLPVNNEKSRLWIFQIADRLELAERLEFQHVFREQQDTARNGRLGFGRLVKVDDLPDLAAAQQPLKCLSSSFDRADELRDGIVHVGFGFDCLPFK